MSLYNLVFGMNPDADKLLALLDATREDFGRFRNVYMEDGFIVVHTRNGGGNREDYQDVFDEMSEHPLYAYDEDDDFDCTYANFYFVHPPEYSEVLKEMAAGTVTPSEKWKMLFKALEKKS